MKDNNKILNCFGEFYDQNWEKKFLEKEMKKTMRFIRMMILISGFLNTLFLIPDYFHVGNKSSFIIIAIIRILFFVMIIVFFVKINNMKDFKYLSYWITFFEMIGVCIFLVVFYLYESPDYLIQAFGVIVLLLILMLVPNRWINTVFINLLLCVGFIAIASMIQDIHPSRYLAGIVYISLIAILCSIVSNKNQKYKRIEYYNSEQLIKLSTTDHLTGIYNRAKFDIELNLWISYSKRNNTPLSLILFDFDHFKKINDTLGHLFGDQIIIETVNIIKKNIRLSDLFARWGGEEFVILLPNTDVIQATHLAEKLRRKIYTHTFKDNVTITCSFGVVQLSCNDNSNSLLLKVDDMLYQAKNSGRNTVKCNQNLCIEENRI